MKGKNNYVLCGGVIGGIVGLILSVTINLVLSRDFYHFLDTLFPRFMVLLVLVLIFSLLGMFVGFLSLLVDSKIIWKGAAVGGILGFIFSIFVMIFWETFGWTIKPISDINYVITGCKNWCIFMIFVYPIVFVFVFVFVFSIVAFIISKFRNRKK